MKQATVFYKSDIGILEIKGTEEGISSIEFFQGDVGSIIDEDGEAFLSNGSRLSNKAPKCVTECVRQLAEYFRGERDCFDVKLHIQGTEFQRKVWEALMKIPFGQTASYGDIAAAVGNRKAVRAVGNANNKNRIPIIIPCHRVIGGDGSLTGYGGGLWRKEWLLNHEKKVSERRFSE
jgi:methylated-DNA-[protein]-cysteine S-methyltransferase